MPIGIEVSVKSRIETAVANKDQDWNGGSAMEPPFVFSGFDQGATWRGAAFAVGMATCKMPATVGAIWRISTTPRSR